MFKIDDYIMYGVTGVCKVKDIEEKLINNIKKNYYVLSAIYSQNMIIRVPVDNDKINMRRLHSKKEIYSLINSMESRETLWIENDKERNEKFKLMLKNAKCEDLIVLIKSIDMNKNNKAKIGKKNHKSDEDIMKSAESLLKEEFATILGIELDQVTPYILKNIPKEC